MPSIPAKWDWRVDELSGTAQGLAKGLVSLIPFWDESKYDVVRRMLPDQRGKLAPIASIEGPVHYDDGAGSDHLRYEGFRPHEQPTTEITVIMRHVQDTTDQGGGDSWYVGHSDDTSGWGVWSLKQQGGGEEFMAFHTEIGGGGFAHSGYSTLVNGTLYQSVGRWRTGGDYQIRSYDRNGAQVLESLGVTARTGTLSYAATNHHYLIGRNNDVTPDPHVIKGLYVAVWKRRLSGSETDWLARHPYALMERVVRPVVKAPAAGPATQTLTGVTLSVTPTLPVGTLTPGAAPLTGVVLTVTPSLPVGTLTPGAATLTGALLTVTPSLPVGTIATSTPGAQTLTGVVLTVTPTLPAGTITGGAVVIAGVLLSLSVLLPIGILSTPGVGSDPPTSALPNSVVAVNSANSVTAAKSANSAVVT